MIPTTFLAQFIGIMALVFGVVSLYRSELILQWLQKAIRRPSVFFLIGSFEFMAGLFILLSHQEWSSFPAALISAIGWLMMLESLLYLTLPSASIAHMYAEMDTPAIIAASAIISIGLGGTLTLFGFGLI